MHLALSDSDVIDMRRLYISGLNVKECADQFEVSRWTARRALRGSRAYSHIQDPPPIPILGRDRGNAQQRSTNMDKSIIEVVEILIGHNWETTRIANVLDLDSEFVSEIRRRMV